MTLLIRPEQPTDHAAIRTILIDAFADHPFSRQTEHLIVEALRADDAQTVALVAVRDGAVVGHIVFSIAPIDGRDQGWHLLGPLAVAPALQRQGIGQALVREGLTALRDLGAQGCVLVGDPAYYVRLGFGHHEALHMVGVPAENMMCLCLDGPMPRGCVTHHPAFAIEPDPK